MAPPQSNNAEEGAISRREVEQYFTGAYLGVLRAHQRWRTAIRTIQVLTIVFGAGLVAAAVYLSWGDPATFGPRLLQMLHLLLPGLLLCVIGALPWLWKFGWELPAGLVALVTAAEAFYFHIGHLGFSVVLLVCATAAIAYGIRLRIAGRKQPLDLQALETKLDGWTDELVRRTLARWAEELPPKAGSAQNERVLRSFPKPELSGSPDVLCRVGTDGKLRITPLGVVIFDLGPDSLLVYEGAIDLRREQVLYARAHEFRYGHIAGLHWFSDGVPEGTMSAAANMIVDRVTSPGADATQPKAREAAPRRRDRLEIQLAAGEGVSIVFRDSALLPRGRQAAPELQALEDRAHIRSLWTEIARRRQAAGTS